MSRADSDDGDPLGLIAAKRTALKLFSLVMIVLAVTAMDRPAASENRQGAGPYARPGFVTVMDGDWLWVFRENSSELAAFARDGELAKHTTRIGVGPAGLTVKAPDTATVLEYLAAKPGFDTLVNEDRVWVFREGSQEFATVSSGGELSKHVTRVNAGPLEATLKAPDNDTLDEYITSKEGFVTRVVEGRLWVFHEGSSDLRVFESKGELAKHVTHVGAGPSGMTIKAPNHETIVDYITKVDGFETFVNSEGRLWVFRQNSDELNHFYNTGKPEKHVTLVGAGPLGLTIKAPDTETADAYVRVLAVSQ